MADLDKKNKHLDYIKEKYNYYMHSVNNTSALSSDERIERAMYGQGKKNKKPKTWLNLSIKELKIYIITLSPI